MQDMPHARPVWQGAQGAANPGCQGWRFVWGGVQYSNSVNLKSSFAFAVAAILLSACGAAPAQPVASATSNYPPKVIHADPPQGAGVPTPTPTPAPEMPHSGVVIKIPQLGIALTILEGRGLEPDYGFADAFPGMKWPGEGGRSFIYAHAQPGMFGSLLGSGAVGQHVQIDEPDGRILHYTIASFTRNWPVTDTSILQPTNHEEMVLYTCTSWTYSDPKVVAIALPDAQFITG
jgi:sortase (surface protein transpeptidase)